MPTGPRAAGHSRARAPGSRLKVSFDVVSKHQKATSSQLQIEEQLLHPDLHRVHHERYDCNFPILTGWTNRYVQFLYEASVRCGLVDTGLGQKPTAIGPTKS